VAFICLVVGLKTTWGDVTMSPFKALRWLNHALGVGTDSMQQSLTHEILLTLIASGF